MATCGTRPLLPLSCFASLSSASSISSFLLHLYLPLPANCLPLQSSLPAWKGRRAGMPLASAFPSALASHLHYLPTLGSSAFSFSTFFLPPTTFPLQARSLLPTPTARASGGGAFSAFLPPSPATFSAHVAFSADYYLLPSVYPCGTGAACAALTCCWRLPRGGAAAAPCKARCHSLMGRLYNCCLALYSPGTNRLGLVAAARGAEIAYFLA